MHLGRMLIVLTLAALSGACAHTSKDVEPNLTNKTASNGSSQDASKAAVRATSSTSAGVSAAVGQAGDAVASETEGPDLDDSGKDLNAIPLEVNRMVLQWVDYYQGRGREHFERHLSRSTRYIPMMKEILKKQGLPEDLVYIALIESGFSAKAKSTASAVGYWQFIRGTGRLYGLRIDSYVDERRDFVKSTESAAQYFKALYDIFGSWYLAIASYNVGEGRIKKLVAKYHTKDFWQLVREGHLPKETINYLPKFTAARMIAKDPEKYGFTDIEYQDALAYEEVESPKSIDLRRMSEALAVDYDDLHDLNPAFKRGVVLSKAGPVNVRVPVGTKEKALAALESSSVITKQVLVAAADDDDFTYYRIRRGDNLNTIARRYHTTPKRIRSLNHMRSHNQLVAGKKIRVPNDYPTALARQELKLDRQKSAPTRKIASKKKDNEAGLGSPQRIHVVRKGESLVKIARQYHVPITELAQFNQLRRRSRVVAGTRLSIPD